MKTMYQVFIAVASDMCEITACRIVRIQHFFINRLSHFTVITYHQPLTFLSLYTISVFRTDFIVRHKEDETKTDQQKQQQQQ